MRISEEAYNEMLRNGAKVNDAMSVDKTGDRPGNAAHPLSSSAGRAALPPITLERRALVKGEKAPLEHNEQVALFKFTEQWFPYYPQLRLMFAIPNGAKLPFTRNAQGQRYSKQAKILIDEGLRSGVPDIFLAVPSRGKHGCFIELKRADRSNRPSEEQKWWINQLSVVGYQCSVCYGASEAWEVIKEYLGINEDVPVNVVPEYNIDKKIAKRKRVGK